MKQLFVFAGLQLKRLFRKKSFILLLLLMPLATFVLSLASKSEASILKVGLVHNPADPISAELVGKLCNDDSAISFLEISDKDTAIDLVEKGDINFVFVMDDELTRLLSENITLGYSNHYMTLYTREKNIEDSMTAVKVCSSLFPAAIDILYKDYMKNEVGIDLEQAALIHDELNEFYSAEDLIEMRYIGDEKPESESDESSYITSPLRGLLACWIVLLGMAANLYFLEDEKNGVLGLFSLRKRFALSLVYEVIPMLCGAVVAFLTMLGFGIISFSGMELLNLLILVLGSIGLCSLLRELAGDMAKMGALIPVIMIWMVIACPIFHSLKKLRLLSYAFPVSHYLFAEGIGIFRLTLLAYGLLLTGVSYCIRRLVKR